jgi:hypothetical protein
MTTSEFIKMLQDADPSGTAHIRIDGDIPYAAVLKQGYWDGPYSYLKDGKWVYSTKNSKVDIYSISKEDIVSEVLDEWNPFKESDEGLWEKVESKFIFELTYVHTEDRIKNFMKPVKEFYDDWVKFRKSSWEKHLDDVVALHERGCKFLRKKETQNKWYYGWKFINENNPKDVGCANLATTYPILESGKFKEIEYDNEYYEYILVE